MQHNAVCPGYLERENVACARQRPYMVVLNGAVLSLKQHKTGVAVSAKELTCRSGHACLTLAIMHKTQRIELQQAMLRQTWHRRSATVMMHVCQRKCSEDEPAFCCMPGAHAHAGAAEKKQKEKQEKQTKEQQLMHACKTPLFMA